MFSQQARWDRRMPGDGHQKWEHAEVFCRFSGGKIVPLRFVVGAGSAATVVVSKVNYAWTERQGKVTLHLFSVSDSRDTYRLCFDPEAMSWQVSSLQ